MQGSWRPRGAGPETQVLAWSWVVQHHWLKGTGSRSGLPGAALQESEPAVLSPQMSASGLEAMARLSRSQLLRIKPQHR